LGVLCCGGQAAVGVVPVIWFQVVNRSVISLRYSTGGGDRFVRGAGPESGQDLPGGEALDELGALRVGDRVEVGDEPALE
jgi:hypothetical protein